MPNLRIRLKHALARRKRFVTATTERYTLNLDTQYTKDVGQVLGQRRKMERGKWEPVFIDACFQHITPRDTVFEIGTWIGPYSVIIGKYIGASRVIGFEPDPVAFRQCVLNLNLNQVKNVFVLPFAMSDTAGSVALFTNRIFGNSGSSIFQNNPATQSGAQEQAGCRGGGRPGAGGWKKHLKPPGRENLSRDSP